MSTEIDRLKADISVLERVGREGGYANGYAVDPLIGQMKCKLQRMEEESKDPHKEAKYLVNLWEAGCQEDSDLLKVAKYVKHLVANDTRLTLERDKLQKWINETMHAPFSERFREPEEPRTVIRGSQTNGL